MSKKTTCPVCGHYDDWCNELRGQNGKLYGCHRTFNLKLGEEVNGKDGLTYVLISKKNGVGVFEEKNQLESARKIYQNSKNYQKFLHKENFIEITYDKSKINKNVKIEQNKNKRSEKELDKISEIYSNFLLLQDDLSDEAKNDLKSSSWNNDLIKNCNYKSAKTDSKSKEKICEILEKKYGRFKNIPGFYYKNNKPTYNMLPSILIPNIDLKGRIISITIKPLNRNFKEIPKYYYFSSKDKEGGSSAINEISCIVNKEKFNKILLTEGQKKAFVFENMFNIPSFSINGIGSYYKFLDEDFLKYLRDNKVIDIMIAFDSDYKINNLVKEALVNTSRKLKILGFNVFILDWDLKYKGIDDLILKGLKPRVLFVDNIK